MEFSKKELNQLIIGMKQAYLEGKNATEFARTFLNKYSDEKTNYKIAILLAYDLQAGTYVENVLKNNDFYKSWCKQLTSLINPIFPDGGSILEVGVGEATTLSGILELLGNKVRAAFGFDLSWSRLMITNKYLKQNNQEAKMFVADLSNIPLPDNSVDIVYSFHSFEPNRGLEEIMILECMRVARKAVVIVEPIYELASQEAKIRMDHHGYVKGLYDIAKRLNLEILDYRLLKYTGNTLNPSGVLSLAKKNSNSFNSEMNSNTLLNKEFFWICPVTGHRLAQDKEKFLRSSMGIAYPTMSGIPLLRKEHAIISSKFSGKLK
jgi:ubiquinone/menaquinone biosynthesis C-methylase UbiE